LEGVDAPDLAPDLRRGAAVSGAVAPGAAQGWKAKGASRVQHMQAGQRRAFHREHGLRCGRLWGGVQQVRRACAHNEEELQFGPLMHTWLQCGPVPSILFRFKVSRLYPPNEGSLASCEPPVRF